MKRKTILIDLDGVVYNWTQSMAEWLHINGATQTRTPYELMRQYSNWEVWDDWNIPHGEFMRWWRLGVEAGVIYGEGIPIPGARKALWALNDAEWHISICTYRLTKFGLHDKIVENTVNWLRTNNIPYRDLLFVSDKTKIMADAIVDDKVDNIDGEVHGWGFLFPANHNTGEFVNKAEQIDTWSNIVATLGSGLQK